MMRLRRVTGPSCAGEKGSTTTGGDVSRGRPRGMTIGVSYRSDFYHLYLYGSHLSPHARSSRAPPCYFDHLSQSLRDESLIRPHTLSCYPAQSDDPHPSDPPALLVLPYAPPHPHPLCSHPSSSPLPPLPALQFATTTPQPPPFPHSLPQLLLTLLPIQATLLYSKPFHSLLQSSLPHLSFINSPHILNFPPHNTHVSHSFWARLCSSTVSCSPSSSLPSLSLYRLDPLPQSRDLRRGRESQPLHKILLDAGVKLSSVSSSVLTKSAPLLTHALIAHTLRRRARRDAQAPHAQQDPSTPSTPSPPRSTTITPCCASPCSPSSISPMLPSTRSPTPSMRSSPLTKRPRHCSSPSLACLHAAPLCPFSSAA